jgi:hypothetical protein
MHARIWHAAVQGVQQDVGSTGYLLLWSWTESGSKATEVGHAAASLLRGLFWCG